MKNLPSSPFINVLLFSVFWAFEVFIAKVAFLSGAQLVPFSLQSTGITLLIFSLYIFLFKREELKKIRTLTLIWLLIANAVHFGVGGFLSNAGVQLTTAINAGFLLQFTVVTGTVLAWLVLKEQMTVSKIALVGMIILGTFFLITKGQLIIPHIGDVLLLLACLAWSIGGVMIRLVLKRKSVHPDVVSFLRPIAGIPVMVGFILLSPLYPQPVKSVFQTNIFAIHQELYIVLNAFFISLTWIFVNRTLNLASASYTAMLSSVTSILVAFLALTFLHERIEIIQLFGMFLIIAASFAVQYFQYDKH